MVRLLTIEPKERRVADGALPLVQGQLRALFDEQFWPMVRLATAMLGSSAAAEDVVQQAFVSVGPRLERVTGGGEVAYLRKAVMNGCKSHARHEGARKRRPVLVPDEPVERPDDRAEHTEAQRRVLAALDGLPLRQRQCLVLRYYGGLSDSEVAASLDLSLGSAKTHLRRGLTALHDHLEDLR
jgi:RNA polymerase sigma factor (sigma-70 family)